jgi:hypothetical protein
VGVVDIMMVTGLFQKVKEILAGDIFEKEKQEGGSLKGAMKSDNIGMQMQRLMNGNLRWQKLKMLVKNKDKIKKVAYLVHLKS